VLTNSTVLNQIFRISDQSTPDDEEYDETPNSQDGDDVIQPEDEPSQNHDVPEFISKNETLYAKIGGDKVRKNWRIVWDQFYKQIST